MEINLESDRAKRIIKDYVSKVTDLTTNVWVMRGHSEDDPRLTQLLKEVEEMAIDGLTKGAKLAEKYGTRDVGVEFLRVISADQVTTKVFDTIRQVEKDDAQK